MEANVLIYFKDHNSKNQSNAWESSLLQWEPGGDEKEEQVELSNS